MRHSGDGRISPSSNHGSNDPALLIDGCVSARILLDDPENEATREPLGRSMNSPS
jgi:hypothetical protein